MAEYKSSAETLKISLVQTILAWEDPAANRQLLTTQMAGLDATDLVILPEMFSTGFSMASAHLAETMTGPTVRWMREQAASLDAVVCGSLIISDDGHYYNRFIWMPADGDVQCYDKKHLFRMSTEHEHYSPGAQRCVVSLLGFRICLQVCYDLRFPVWSRNQHFDKLQLHDYDMLLYVANWPATRRQHWRSLLQARAIENQSYVVGVNRLGSDGKGINYAGDSLLFDFNGEPLADLLDRPGCPTLSVDLQPLRTYREAFPAWRDADGFDLHGDDGN
jgi:omega-amidase